MQLFFEPKHPYTTGLLGSIPVAGARREWLEVIPGSVPNLIDMPPGCRFASRCQARVEHDLEICTEQMPELIEISPGHQVRCWLYEQSAGRRDAGRGDGAMSEPSEPLVRVEQLVKTYPVRAGVFQRTLGEVRAVDGVDLEIMEGETLGLVGESGCGKSTLGRAILRLEEPDSGRIVFGGREITGLGVGDMRAVRAEMQLIFQDPFSSLDPRTTISESIGEGLRVQGIGRSERRRRINEALEMVGSGGIPRSPLSPRVLRWAASAGGHRPRPGGRAAASSSSTNRCRRSTSRSSRRS